jgi:hypothetical protein
VTGVDGFDALDARAGDDCTGDEGAVDAGPVDAGARDHGGHRFLVSFTGAPDPLIKALAGYDVQSLHSRDADLEAVFLRYYRDEGSR